MTGWKAAPRRWMLGAIDDATGKVVYAHFRASEDQLGYLLMLRTVALTHGLPHILYHDRHTTLRSPKQATIEDELAGRRPQSQIQRIIAQLGITSIPALSPQAKGRIERLWQTFQDRLIKEMRLAGIASLEQANLFLETFIPAYNQRFAKPARDPQPPGEHCRPSWIWTVFSPLPWNARSKRTTPSPIVA